MLILLLLFFVNTGANKHEKISLENQQPEKSITNDIYYFGNYYEVGVQLKLDDFTDNTDYKLWYFPEDNDCDYCVITYQDGRSKQIKKYNAINYKIKSADQYSNLIEVLMVTSYDSNNIPKYFSKVNIYWDEDNKIFYSSSLE